MSINYHTTFDKVVFNYSDPNLYLQALVHVSSAYVNSFKLETEEILYPAPDDAEKVIGFANTLSEDALDELTPK